MKLNEWVDSHKLNEHIAEGLVTMRNHPKHPLVILNYSPAASGVKNWDLTLSRCRGLIYHRDTEEIYAIPFSKFWNYNDASHPETLQENLPNSEPEIYEKVDGSLGIGFFYEGEFIIATRGSFESDQAKWAQSWAQDHWISGILHPDGMLTYLFEIVMPGDRKVVDYDFTGLVLLGYVINRTGEELRTRVLGDIHWLYGYKVAKKIPYEDLEKLQQKDLPNEEGYVAVWYNGTSTQRVKIKFETYKKLHRLYFQTTTDVIWELLKNQGDIGEYAQATGDPSLRAWVLAKSIEIAVAKAKLEEDSKYFFRNCIAFVNNHFEPTQTSKERRKAFAMYAVHYKEPGLMFLLYDAKFDEYQESLWKIVKPKNSFYRKDEECL